MTLREAIRQARRQIRRSPGWGVVEIFVDGERRRWQALRSPRSR